MEWQSFAKSSISSHICIFFSFSSKPKKIRFPEASLWWRASQCCSNNGKFRTTTVLCWHMYQKKIKKDKKKELIMLLCQLDEHSLEDSACWLWRVPSTLPYPDFFFTNGLPERMLVYIGCISFLHSAFSNVSQHHNSSSGSQLHFQSNWKQLQKIKN